MFEETLVAAAGSWAKENAAESLLGLIMLGNALLIRNAARSMESVQETVAQLVTAARELANLAATMDARMRHSLPAVRQVVEEQPAAAGRGYPPRRPLDAPTDPLPYPPGTKDHAEFSFVEHYPPQQHPG